MLKFGHITEIDASKGLAKVKFDEDDIVSDWIKIGVRKSKEDKDSHGYDADEHVACLMDERCENGVVVCAVYDENNQPDGGNADKVRVKFKDGASVEYDRSNHTLTIDGIEKAIINTKEATITADTKVKIDCSDNEITGDLKVGGKLDVTGNIKSTSGDVENATGIKLGTHKHVGVTPGPGTTGIPTP